MTMIITSLVFIYKDLFIMNYSICSTFYECIDLFYCVTKIGIT